MPPSLAHVPVYLLGNQPEETALFITFADLRGIGSWSVALTLVLVLVGFFPLAVLLGVGALWILTAWRASQ